MTDREMLKFAAKAAGIDYHATREDGTKCIHDGRGYWNPLADDGDALRLAVKLRMDIAHFSAGVRADVTGYDDCYQPNDDDPLAATRRAIVRAAAEIGKGMK